LLIFPLCEKARFSGGIPPLRAAVSRSFRKKLLSEANESGPENLPSSTFLLADVGKLYLLLARAVGLLN
jgi:hypothetical protein